MHISDVLYPLGLLAGAGVLCLLTSTVNFVSETEKATGSKSEPVATEIDASRTVIASSKPDVRHFFGFIISIIDLTVSRDMRVKSLN